MTPFEVPCALSADKETLVKRFGSYKFRDKIGCPLLLNFEFQALVEGYCALRAKADRQQAENSASTNEITKKPSEEGGEDAMDKFDIQALKALKEVLVEWGLEENRAKNLALELAIDYHPNPPVFCEPASHSTEIRDTCSGDTARCADPGRGF